MDVLTWYSGRRVFVTGHTGFKGSWLCRMLLGAGARVYGYALPPEPGALFGLAGLEGLAGHTLADICDFEALRAAYNAAAPEVVFHLAAQPLVRRAYGDPRGTYATNVMGTVNLLECVRLGENKRVSVVNVTTDKVYQNNEWPWGYRENDKLDGYDPYSNSKSCSELVTGCYKRALLAEGAAVSAARAGNVIGGGDFSENRVLPDCYRAAAAGRPVELRNPTSTRPYQHVLDPLSAYLLLAQRQVENPRLAGNYNIGPGDDGCAETGALAGLFCAAWGGGQQWVATGAGGPHEAGLLRLDCALIRNVLGWQPRWSLPVAVEKTVEWYKAHLAGGDLPALMDAQIKAYMEA